MIEGACLPPLTINSLNTFDDYISRIICNPPTPGCYLRKCDACPGYEYLADEIRSIFNDSMVEKISYNQWVTIDRSSLKTLQCTDEEFIEKFSDKFLRLLPHSFITKVQGNVFNRKKIFSLENAF